MSVKTASVFTCNHCNITEHATENAYDVPPEWFTIRISKNVVASAADDLHVCHNCQYESVLNLWETVIR